MNDTLVKRIITLLDFTELGDDLAHLSMTDPLLSQRTLACCREALSEVGSVAAVCVYPQAVPIAKQALSSHGTRVATVLNFPKGDQPIDVVEKEIQQVIGLGADEVDIVMPYHLVHTEAALKAYLTRCRAAAQGHCLKIILETGALTPEDILRATHWVCEVGADFVKTSTGKYLDPVTHQKKGATLESVQGILSVLKARQAEGQAISGIKLSGGVTSENVLGFLRAIEEVMGVDWVCKENVRIGASAALSPRALLQYRNVIHAD